MENIYEMTNKFLPKGTILLMEDGRVIIGENENIELLAKDYIDVELGIGKGALRITWVENEC